MKIVVHQQYFHHVRIFFRGLVFHMDGLESLVALVDLLSMLTVKNVGLEDIGKENVG